MSLFNSNYLALFTILYFTNCVGNRPELQNPSIEPSVYSSTITSDKSDKNEKIIHKQHINDNDDSELVSMQSDLNDQKFLKNTTENEINNQVPKANLKKDSDPYSNYIRIKTVYELAMESNPTMFLPHDEFETVSEYKTRVTEQVVLMKEIVQLTTQKSQIKKEKRLQVSKEKELKRKSVIETLMTESSSAIEFKPTDIGRYDPENETFPLILFDMQYQITVPREEARTFKTNFESVRIKGIQQLKPKYDVKINVTRAHIRSRPNGSIIGVASQYDQFEHIVDVDEWYKINFKGQFGFTHMNNAKLKLIDIANEYEYHDLVAIHPTTGSMYAMVSIDKLVKAPLNLASRKYESGKPDGPSQSY